MSLSTASTSFRAILFDLDGTLLNTLDDIASAANRVLAARGFPAHPTEAYRQFIGEGVPRLFARALPENAATPEQAASCAVAFRDEYAQTWNRASHLYEGIPELLDALTAHGIPLAILSNKPDSFTHECTRHYLARWPFQPVHGAREGIPPKPDPRAALAIADELGRSPESILYLGDTRVDMNTARDAGMFAVGAAWGFRDADELWNAGAREVIHHPAELLAILDETGSLPPPR